MKKRPVLPTLLSPLILAQATLACSWGQSDRIIANGELARYYGGICLILVVFTFAVRVSRGNLLNLSFFFLVITLGYFAGRNAFWHYQGGSYCGEVTASMARLYAQFVGGLLAWQITLMLWQVWKRCKTP